MSINPDELALQFAEQVTKRDHYEIARETGKSIFDEVAQIMDSLIADIERNLQPNMDTANLSQSFEPEVFFSGNSFFFRLLAADYYDYLNKGVSGARQARTGTPYSFTTKKPPVNVSNVDGRSLRQWAQRKGLNEWAVRESIFQKGIKGTGYFDRALQKNFG